MEDSRYIYLKIPNTDLTVQVKMEIEGVVLDVFEGEGEDLENVATTFKFYTDMNLIVQDAPEETE